MKRRQHIDAARIGFDLGEKVSFSVKEKELTGYITKLNKNRACVYSDGSEWRVPYQRLTAVASKCGLERSLQHLADVELEAYTLLNVHGLQSWNFTYDQATNRGGLCSHSTKQISLSERFALIASAKEITDTLLHEIAHALVGPNHQHDATWRETAKRIGCTANVTHDVQFATARWLMTCLLCDWRQPRHRRRRGLTCKWCSNPVSFIPNEALLNGNTPN